MGRRSPFAGAWQGGQYNGVMALEPQGGAGANRLGGLDLLLGRTVQHRHHLLRSSTTQGAVGLTGLSQRHEDAFGVGGTYSVAPGMLAFWEYIYGQRHQAGFDLNNGKYFNQAGYAGNNDNHTQAALLGVRVRW